MKNEKGWLKKAVQDNKRVNADTLDDLLGVEGLIVTAIKSTDAEYVLNIVKQIMNNEPTLYDIIRKFNKTRKQHKSSL